MNEPAAPEQATDDTAAADRQSAPTEPVADTNADALDLDAIDADTNADALDLDLIDADLDGVERALERLADGSYWTDEVTGDALDDGLLATNPTARRAAG